MFTRGIEITYTPQKGIRVSMIYDWESVDKSLLSSFEEELYDKPEVRNRLIETGFSSEDEILRQYLICQYGGNDNRPDDIKSDLKSDYCHCGMRGNCVNENFPGLCSLPLIEGEIITPAELENLQLSAQDMSVKVIADTRHRSHHTSTSQMKTIRKKLRVNSMSGAVAKAMKMGFVKL